MLSWPPTSCSPGHAVPATVSGSGPFGCHSSYAPRYGCAPPPLHLVQCHSVFRSFQDPISPFPVGSSVLQQQDAASGLCSQLSQQVQPSLAAHTGAVSGARLMNTAGWYSELTWYLCSGKPTSRSLFLFTVWMAIRHFCFFGVGCASSTSARPWGLAGETLCMLRQTRPRGCVLPVAHLRSVRLSLACVSPWVLSMPLGHLLPLLFSFSSPSAAVTWSGGERASGRSCCFWGTGPCSFFMQGRTAGL